MIPLMTVCLFIQGACAESSSAQPADRILENGQIYTVNPEQPWAEAVAFSAGEIVFVGTDAAAQAWVGPHTQRFDLQGRTVIPGFHDSHVHLLEAFHRAQGTCLLSAGVNPELWIPELQGCAPQQVGTDWVLGVGHSIYDLVDHIEAGGRPPVEILDDAAGDQPLVILEETSHSVWANSAALEAAGIDSSTPHPPGGWIMKDASGQPNGVLLDGAGEILLDMALAPNPELEAMNDEALALGLQRIARHGITSVVDARAHWRRGYVESYQRAEAKGELTARVVLSLWAYPYLDDTEQIAALTDLYSNDPGSYLRASQIKIYSDGEINHRTAALLEPYSCCPLAGSTGLNYFDQSRLSRYIDELGAVGFDFHIHAIGDRGVHESLNAIENEQQPGARHRLTHLELIQPEDLPRFAALGAIADFQMSFDSVEPGHAFELEFLLGAGRIEERSWRLRSLFEAGATIVLSSDYDVGELSPFAGMKRALTRGDQSLPSLDEAMRAYTINAAFLMRQEDRVGSIEVGKRADLVILDRNPFQIPVQQLDQVQVEVTLLDGDAVFGPDPFPGPTASIFNDDFESGDLTAW